MVGPSCHAEGNGSASSLCRPEAQPEGRRALIIATSHDTLGDTGKKTGVFASEMTAPYYAFLDAGMEVDVVSIKGGAIPVEPMSGEMASEIGIR